MTGSFSHPIYTTSKDIIEAGYRSFLALYRNLNPGIVRFTIAAEGNRIFCSQTEHGVRQGVVMRHAVEKAGVLLGLILTLTWPILLGVAIAGQAGLVFGAILYGVFVVLFLLLIVLGSIRGILSS